MTENTHSNIVDDLYSSIKEVITCNGKHDILGWVIPTAISAYRAATPMSRSEVASILTDVRNLFMENNITDGLVTKADVINSIEDELSHYIRN